MNYLGGSNRTYTVTSVFFFRKYLKKKRGNKNPPQNNSRRYLNRLKIPSSSSVISSPFVRSPNIVGSKMREPDALGIRYSRKGSAEREEKRRLKERSEKAVCVSPMLYAEHLLRPVDILSFPLPANETAIPIARILP